MLWLVIVIAGLLVLLAGLVWMGWELFRTVDNINRNRGE